MESTVSRRLPALVSLGNMRRNRLSCVFAFNARFSFPLLGSPIGVSSPISRKFALPSGPRSDRFHEAIHMHSTQHFISLEVRIVTLVPELGVIGVIGVIVRLANCACCCML